MGFRNPVLSLSADQITPGTLGPGVTLPADQLSAGTLSNLVIARSLADGAVKAPAIAAGAVGADAIAANAIDGKVITGAVIRTAAAGRRVEVRGDQNDRVRWFSGDTAESQRGELLVAVSDDPSQSSRQAYLYLTPPSLRSDLTRPAITLNSRSPAGGVGQPNQILIDPQGGQVDLAGTTKAWGTLEVIGDISAANLKMAPDHRMAFGDTGAVKVGNSVGLINAVSFVAKPFATRVYVSAEGVAGFETVAVTVGVRVGIGAGLTLTQRTQQLVQAAAGQWATVTRQAIVDVPANTAAGIYLASEVAGGNAYFRTAMQLVRVAV